jgi:hypothetical protein
MGRRIQIIVGLIAVVSIGLLLWPIFAAGEVFLPVALIAFLAGGGVLVVIAARSPLKWSRYALVGIVPGFFIGGIGMFAIIRIGSSGSDGWEALVAIGAGLLGAFAGSISGAVAGGVIGYRMDNQERESK